MYDILFLYVDINSVMHQLQSEIQVMHTKLEIIKQLLYRILQILEQYQQQAQTQPR